MQMLRSAGSDQQRSVLLTEHLTRSDLACPQELRHAGALRSNDWSVLIEHGWSVSGSANNVSRACLVSPCSYRRTCALRRQSAGARHVRLRGRLSLHRRTAQ
jgi:hypothetical protein